MPASSPRLLAFLALLLAGCRGPEVPSPQDAGVLPLDPGEAETLAEAFLDAREVRGVESCRCAGDVPFCEADTIPPLSASERACLVEHLEAGGVAFRDAIPCLLAAAEAYATCGAPLSCPEVEARMACLASYEAEGSACLADSALAGLLSGCLPELMD